MTMTTEQSVKVLREALDRINESKDNNTCQLSRYVDRRFTDNEVISGKLSAETDTDAMVPVDMEIICNDEALRQMDLTIAIGRNGTGDTAGKRLIDGVLLSWNVANMTESEYKDKKNVLESYIIAKELSREDKMFDLLADQKNSRWRRMPKRFDLGELYPVVYNLAEALRLFGFLYNSADEMSQDIKSREPFLPVLIEAINERYVCMATEDRKIRITAKKEGMGNDSEMITFEDAVWASQRTHNHDDFLSVEKFSDFRGLNFRKTYIISEPDDWRKWLCAALIYQWKEYIDIRHDLLLRHDAYHTCNENRFINKAMFGEPLGCGEYGIKYRHAMDNLTDKSCYMASHVVSLVHKADVAELKAIGGAPQFIMRAAHDITKKFIQPVLDDYETVKKFGYKDAIAKFEPIVKMWQDRMDNYERMLEECDEEHCEILPQCHHYFRDAAWGAYDDGVLTGNKKAIYERNMTWEEMYGTALCQHPEYRRGYRFGYRNAVCPHCTTFYEYDEERNGEEIICTGCGRPMIVKRGSLVDKEIYEKSSVCEITGDKEHQFRHYTSTIVNRGQVDILKTCVCGATRKDWILKSGIMWIGAWSDGEILRADGFTSNKLPEQVFND